MKCLLVVAIAFISFRAVAQSGDEKAIRETLDQQTKFWNTGNLEKFMEGYWNNDSLMFIGKTGVTYGYKNTLENYKKGYPDTAAMGKLHFDIIDVRRLSPEYFHVLGKWSLKRSIGDVSGHFTLLWRKIKGKWVCIADHSS